MPVSLFTPRFVCLPTFFASLRLGEVPLPKEVLLAGCPCEALPAVTAYYGAVLRINLLTHFFLPFILLIGADFALHFIKTHT
jgi:hypothetical protein